MYSTCLFCNQSLGSNEVVEAFPVGRRLAFDQRRGRLWVVCRKCEKWNLTPLEERWEAIETCERFFRDAKKRVSTDNIGLAKLNEGLELVRIGESQLPEFAAWRYGDQFGRRRRRLWARSMAGGVAYAAFMNLGAAAGLAGVALWSSGSSCTVARTSSATGEWSRVFPTALAGTIRFAALTHSTAPSFPANTVTNGG